MIESREKILIKLKEFEEKQINPTRFRRKNAEELERESAERQRILTKLEKTNKALEKCIQTIRFSLKDEVTYNGKYFDRFIIIIWHIDTSQAKSIAKR